MKLLVEQQLSLRMESDRKLRQPNKKEKKVTRFIDGPKAQPQLSLVINDR